MNSLLLILFSSRILSDGSLSKNVVEFYIPESGACANGNTWAFHAQNLPMVETVFLEDKEFSLNTQLST